MPPLPRPWIVFAAVSLFGPACSSDGGAAPAPDSGPPPVTCSESAGPYAPLSTRCNQLVDATGRVVLYRGINARVRGVFDSDLGPGKVPLMPKIPDTGEADFARMRQIGFDLVRLPIQWSAVEPEDTTPPKYDTAYLDRVKATVAAAKKQGVMVLVDIHQDAFSKWIGQDGAPLWAISPAPTKILEGPLTDLGDRRLSKQVADAFHTFFSRTSPDGARLRARFAAMAAKVAAHLAGDDGVLAIELFNEPEAKDEELRAFHGEVGVEIRKVDPKRLIAFEPPVARNFLDRSLVPDTPLALGGTIYAPHVYTKVFSTGCDDKCRNDFSMDSLRPSNENARAEADAWHAPLFVTETGFDPRATRFADWVAFQYRLEDEYLASSAWWVWKENSEGSWGLFDWDEPTDTWKERPYARKAFARPQARALAGWPQSLAWDATAKTFTIVLAADPAITGDTLVHLPLAEDLPAAWKARCDDHDVTVTPDLHGDIAIPCGGPGLHRLVVTGT